MNIDSIPEVDLVALKPFPAGEAVDRPLKRIGWLFFGYILLVIFPAYQALRWWWTPDYAVFAVSDCLTALGVAGVFAIFTIRSVKRTLTVRPIS
tara:strand:- start:60139 stop:60420 length:282 start_codon:yes stop_codon:yes gene_type:complete